MKSCQRRLAVALLLRAASAAVVLPAAAPPGLPPALRKCLQSAGVAKIVDASTPSQLAAAASGPMWNVVHSSTIPLAVAFPPSPAAVAGAVRCARQAGVQVTARSGGGSFLGYSLRPGTLCLDLSRLNSVQVAADKKSVTVQGGVLLGQLYYRVWKDAGPLVAAVAGTCPNVGVGGHILGGGYGYLTPTHGLACDQLLSLTMVDAGGKLVTASLQQNSDLFAASCGGGGGNFGIVTEMKLRLVTHPKVSTIGRFNIAPLHAVDFLVHWQAKVLPKASDKLFLELWLESDGSVSAGAYFPGRRSALGAELSRLGILGPPWLPSASLPPSATSELDWIGTMVASAGSKARNSTPEALLDVEYALSKRPRFAEKSWFALRPLPRAAFAAILKVLQRVDAHMLVHSSGAKTAVRRVRPQDTAFPWRQALYYMKVAKRVRREQDVPQLAKGVETVQTVMAPFFPGQPAYINYVDPNASSDPLWSYYGDNLGWLRKVKRKYDPGNWWNTNPLAIPA